MNSLTHGDANAKNTNTDNSVSQHAVNRLKAHRLWRTLDGTMSLAENLQNSIYDNPEMQVNAEEIDKINEELVKLQERMIKIIGPV